MRLKGKIALVTGAAWVSARRPPKRSSARARVIVADRDQARGGHTVAAIERGGGSAAFVRTDLSTRPSIWPRKPIIS